MTPLNGIPDIAAAAMNFAMQHGQNLPTATTQPGLTGNPQAAYSAAIAQFSPGMSSVNATCDLAEALYAFRNDITDAGSKAAAQTLCGQAAIFAYSNGWNGMGVTAAGSSTPRGLAICYAMQRDLGETAPTGTAWPTTAQDPAPQTVWPAAVLP